MFDDLRRMIKGFYKNIPNIVSLLGVFPVFLLLMENGFQYLIPIIIYNNIMDDLDGILAAKLNLRSRFGANLDNVCDAVSHTIFVMVAAMHFGGGITGVAVAGAVVTGAILLRIVSRLTNDFLIGKGSPTNELIRHMLMLLLLANIFNFDPGPYLIVLFLVHGVSMLAPFPMPFMIRSLARSASAILLVNVALVVAWLAPMARPVIAACFAATYLFSFAVGIQTWITTQRIEK